MQQVTSSPVLDRNERGLGPFDNSVDALLRSRTCQAAAVAVTLLLVAALHAQNDGLWFQGDAPRHAMNGFFWWDLIRAMPTDPVMFAVRYFARYPVISPATYPPLFYVLEGFAFSGFGPTPFVGKLLVLLYAGLAGLYTMSWARRWIGPVAGWAGAFLPFIPGIVLWSNAIMLNVPATALGLACLYHFRRWLEAVDKKHLVLALVSFTALVLTYYQGASVLCVATAWMVLLRRHSRIRSIRLAQLVTISAVAILPLALAAYLAPVQIARHLPVVASLGRVRTWTFYWKVLPDLVGPPALALGLIGLGYGLLVPRWRTEAAFAASWIAAVILAFTLLPAKDPRYILLVAPAFVLAAAIGLASVFGQLAAIRPQPQAAILVVALALGSWSAARVHVPRASGFREVADYLRVHAPTDAVLYDGIHDGLFGFYVRSFDPQFARRVVRADKLLYEYGPSATFRRVETSRVSTTDDVLSVVRAQSGCRWVAVEIGQSSERLASQQLLRQTVERPEFELVRSFPVTADAVHRVDLYRILAPVAPVESVDLVFPAFSTRTFERVVPITR
jgi:hypothetical protein